MEYHGRYRVVRRAAADLRLVDGAWFLYEHGALLATFTAARVRELTGLEPEEAARGGWRCFWQERPRAPVRLPRHDDWRSDRR